MKKSPHLERPHKTDVLTVVRYQKTEGVYLYFTTTFHPTDRNGVGGNNGEKMPQDDILAERKAL